MFKYLLIVFIFSFYSFEIFSSQLALVKSQKAIIYADLGYKNPIGFIRYNKLIKVGDIPKNGKSLLPIIISGRIAYIETKNLRFLNKEENKIAKNGKTFTSYDVDKLFKTDIDKLTENNFLTVRLGQIGLGENWETLAQSFNIDLVSAATSFTLLFEHRHPIKKWSWGVGFGYYSASAGEDLSTSALTLEGNLLWSPFKNKYFITQLFLGLAFSTSLQIKYPEFENNRFTGIENTAAGVLYGHEFGLRSIFFPQSKYNLSLGASLKKLSIADLDIISTPLGTLELDSLGGLNIFLDFSYKF